jgi:glycosyltransferase involved in cell wall biosynthesis
MNVLEICQTHPPEFSGGSTVYTVMLSRALAREGLNVTVLCGSRMTGLPAYATECSQEPDYTLIKIAPPKKNIGRAHRQKIRELCGCLLREHRIDLVNLHSSPQLSEGIVDAANDEQIPCVITLHDGLWVCTNQFFMNNWSKRVCTHAEPAKCFLCRTCLLRSHHPSRWPRLLGRAARHVYWTLTHNIANLEKAEHIVANCEFIQSQHRAFGVKAPMSLIKNQIDQEEIQFKPIGSAHSPIRFGALGIFRRNKGGEVLLNALECFPEDLKHCEVHVWGPVCKSLASRVARVAKHNRLHLHGSYERNQLNQIFSQIDVFLMSSLAESLPMVLLEALASRTPAIAAESHGMVEVVKSEINGLFFRANSSASLANSMRRFIENPELVAQFQANIAPPEPYRNLVRSYVNLYQSLTHGTRSNG